MAEGDPIKASRIWRRFTEASQHFKATYPNKMTTVSYEDLLNNEPSTLSIIGDSLKKSVDTHSPKGQATAPVVSAREEGLHKLVHQQNEPSRAFAWKEDLQHDAGVAIEQTLLCDMERGRYSLYFSERLDDDTISKIHAPSVAALEQTARNSCFKDGSI